MTNHWVDVKNADTILVIGSNCAENHPATFYWIHAAMDKGAKLIVVDPRLTRTAAKADIYAPLRPGTDIAFVGGIINYVLNNKLYHEEYTKTYTNAACLVNPDYKGPAELDGLFSGYNPSAKSYASGSWAYQSAKVMTKVKEKDAAGNEIEVEKEATVPKTDPTLKDPNCVFQLMKRHYARYTLDRVSAVTGCPKDVLEQVAKIFGATGQSGKAGTIIYAMGGTQHTVGTQNVRAYAVLQLLLGNIGIAGGGVNALRGESNVQGSTDLALLSHDLPGYLGGPTEKNTTYTAFAESIKARGGYWSNGGQFFTSLLKAWWGDKATAANDYAYNNLPKRDPAKNYFWIALFEAMFQGKIKGLWVMGQNPAVCGPDQTLERAAMAKLEWMVVQEIFDTETSGFWKKAAGVNPATIKTEVFLLPAAAAQEKEGSVVNSGRVIQWRTTVVPPPGEAKADLWIVDRMYKAVKALYKGSKAAKDCPVLDLNWDYGDEPDVKLVAREINGYAMDDVKDAAGKVILEKGKTIPLFATIANAANPDVIACGCWIHSGYFAEMDDGTGKKMPAAMRRNPADPSGLGLTLNWGFAWPANRRILYNRASADLVGNPWDPSRKVIWWDPEAKTWKGNDVPDWVATKAPDAKANGLGVGLAQHDGASPFIMKGDGKGWLFAPSGMNEGPLPEHYEPAESPVQNAFSKVNLNPVVRVFEADLNKVAVLGSKDFPYVGTTYRLVEHWQSGAMSRNLPWLAEMQPDMFIEIGAALAKELGIVNGDKVEASTARGKVKAVALVTERLRPLNVNGVVVHHVGMPWHYGWQGIATGDSANFLTSHVGDGNTMMPEFKAFLCNVRKAV